MIIVQCNKALFHAVWRSKYQMHELSLMWTAVLVPMALALERVDCTVHVCEYSSMSTESL